jgi:ubiquinone/menaquinone biosynthesis C-methylase UbiE
MKAWIKIERIPSVLATAYAKATRMVIETYYRPVAGEIVANLNEGIILDLGTGPGYLPLEIAKRSPMINVIGVDLSRKLIEMARSNAAKAGLSDRLTFLSGNAGRLEFADSSFDMVISTGMLHSLKQPVKVLQEIHRVLKVGREAWIFDPARVASQVDREKWKASLTLRERFFLWLFKLFGLHKPAKTYTRKQAIAFIKQTDFKNYWIDEREKEIRIKLEKS